MKTRILACLLSVLMLVSMIPVSVRAAESTAWDGTADDSWYNDTDTEFTLTTAEQLAGLAQLVDGGNTFAGKTIKLGADIDLKYVPEGSNEPMCFEPIGSYRKNTPFMGTFDGQGKAICNLSQNTWALDNGYEYGDLGLGLFGKVEDAVIKNLHMNGASISGESAICGTVAATAYGDCLFENIKVSNAQVADYQYYAGGLVGWASGDHRYINCDVDQTTTVAAQWGDFDNSTGGVIGGCGGSATIYMKDCDVACRLDVYNDVTSSYQWYAYRRCGMLIGNPGKTVVEEGTNYASAPQLTTENCTVVYGEWANYTYCEFAGKAWPYVRAQAGISNSAYSNPRYGHPTDANGKEVVDDNHTHNDGEDHQILCKFDQLFGGGQGVYGEPEKPGTEVHKIDEESIANKTYVLMSDETGHWYATEGSNAKLLYTEHYDEEAKLISGENSHYHECDVCGTAFDHEEHTPEAGWRNNASGHWHYCTVCKGTYAFDHHEESDWIIDTDAEVGVEGAQHKECKICGYSPLAEETIPALKPAFDGVLLALVARYAQRFDVTVIAENVTVTGDTTIKYKRSGIVEIAPAEGYEIVEVIANGISLGATDKVEFKKVMADPTLVVITAPVAPAEEVEEVEPETTEPTEEVEVVESETTDLSAAE